MSGFVTLESCEEHDHETIHIDGDCLPCNSYVEEREDGTYYVSELNDEEYEIPDFEDQEVEFVD
jgi:hypothetical protein